jgi:hypothetical protein
MTSTSRLQKLVFGLVLGHMLINSGCSRVVVSTADRLQTAEYLQDPMVQAIFPERLKDLELAMVDQATGLPEFNFEWPGYRGIYQGGGQQMEVLVLEQMTPMDLKTLHASIRQSALETGDNADRLRYNNGSYTFWAADGQIYRIYPLHEDVVVFRTTRNVSELPLVKDYLRQRLTPMPLASTSDPLAIAAP